ncbi:MAG: alpha/beta fold hydrolase [Paraglaciecola sp.]|uniref:alpha/beta fold hydrolase n=1 Tax=Paraglaciecola sp. TaxID=1920173 RepID=UPI003296B00C
MLGAQTKSLNMNVFSKEHELENSYKNVIVPFWDSQMSFGSFQGVADVKIAYSFVKHSKPVGSIVISTGRIESMLKYKEVVFDLYQAGYSVFIHDHRGQGLSGRMLGNKHLGYVTDFSDYVADFKTFIDKVVTQHSEYQPNLLCHSMGGAIGAMTIMRYPNLFKKVAFSAPMFGILPVLPRWLSRTLLSLHKVFCPEPAFFWGQKNYESKPFDRNELTHSQIRYQIFRNEYHDQPDIQLGGVTGSWLKAAIAAMDDIENEASDFPIPSLVIQAGGDTVVDNKRQARVANKLANCRFMIIKKAKHELMEEQDIFRDRAMNAILDFYK